MRFAPMIIASLDMINPAGATRFATRPYNSRGPERSTIAPVRDLRCQVAQSYFDLKLSDETCRLQESVERLWSPARCRAPPSAVVSTNWRLLQARNSARRDTLLKRMADQSVPVATLAFLLISPQDVIQRRKACGVGLLCPRSGKHRGAYASASNRLRSFSDISISKQRHVSYRGCSAVLSHR